MEEFLNAIQPDPGPFAPFLNGPLIAIVSAVWFIGIAVVVGYLIWSIVEWVRAKRMGRGSQMEEAAGNTLIAGIALGVLSALTVIIGVFMGLI